MPNPKVGTVTMNVGQTVSAEKKGKLDFRVEKAGIVHATIGRKSMGADKLRENYLTFMAALIKPSQRRAKGFTFAGSLFRPPWVGRARGCEQNPGRVVDRMWN